MGTVRSTTGPRRHIKVIKFQPQQLRCYLVAGTQDVNNSKEQLVTKVHQALTAGITMFQYREKGKSNLNTAEREQTAQQLKELCHSYQVPFVVDDDIDLAVKVGADGIHVGQNDEQIQRVLKQAGKHQFVGYSCNTLKEIDRANQLGVDYIGSGPVFPTQSKADADPAIGTKKLHQLVQRSRHPLVAIGGIAEDNLSAIAQTDCRGIATISMIMQSPDIAQTVKKVLEIFD